LLCWVGVHCGIYTGSYMWNILYWNSPPQSSFCFFMSEGICDWLFLVCGLMTHLRVS
jgi:hypothetical protein